MNFDLLEIKHKIEEKRLIMGKKIENFLLSKVKNLANFLKKNKAISYFIALINWRKDGFIFFALLIVPQFDPWHFFAAAPVIMMIWLAWITIKNENALFRKDGHLNRFFVSILALIISGLLSLAIINIFHLEKPDEKPIEFFKTNEKN